MDGLDLWGQINATIENAHERVEDMHILGSKFAKAKRDYQVALSKRMAYERTYNNTPATGLLDFIRGQEDIAELRMQKDLADVEFEANREALLLDKKKIDVYREQMAREWSMTNKNMEYPDE